MKVLKQLHWLIYILFFFTCAKQTSPTGGPKDTIPPRLIHAVPPREATNFKGDNLELTFSEMIILNNPKEQLIVTPSIGKDFEIKAKKNKVLIDLNQKLVDNTTYTLNFRESVQDITEKNSARNLQFAFSTGPYIDSLVIEGTVYDLIKAEEKENITVALYPEVNDTFNIFKHPAPLFTKTNKAGKFRIDHLKQDIYHIYAFDDKNRNLFIDSRTELYGFLKEQLILSKNLANLSIPMVRLDTRPLRLSSARPYNSYFNIKTNKNLKDVTLTSLGNPDLYYSFGDDRSNIKLYDSGFTSDSIAVAINGIDSIGNKLDTVVFAKFPKREADLEKFTFKIDQKQLIASKGLLEMSLSFSKPVATINFDSLYFMVDSLTKINLSKEDISWNKFRGILTVRKTMDRRYFPIPDTQGQIPKKDTTRSAADAKPKPINQMYSGMGAFISIERDSSRKTTQKIDPLTPDNLSEIIFNIKTNQKNFIVQLLDNAFNLIHQQSDKLKGSFENLEPREYMLRVVLDLNDNGQWDAGNYFNKTEPEPIIYYRDDKKSRKISLKPNWELVLPMLINY